MLAFFFRLVILGNQEISIPISVLFFFITTGITLLAYFGAGVAGFVTIKINLANYKKNFDEFKVTCKNNCQRQDIELKNTEKRLKADINGQRISLFNEIKGGLEVIKTSLDYVKTGVDELKEKDKNFDLRLHDLEMKRTN